MFQLVQRTSIYNRKNILSSSRDNGIISSWCIWGIAASFFFYQYILRVSPGVIANDLMRELSITAYSIGVITSFYYYGYTLMQIPAGIILDRFGLQFPLTFATLLCAIGTFVFVISETIVFLSCGRLLMGIGSAFGLLSCIKAATLLFPSQRLGMIIGLSIMLGNIGGASVGGCFAKIASSMAWQPAFIMFGIIGCVIALLSWVFIRNLQPFQVSSVFPMNDNKNIKLIFKEAQILSKNSQTWIFGVYGLLMQMSLSSFGELWGVSYLVRVYEIDYPLASTAVSFLFLGMTVGSPFLAWATNIIHSHRILMRAGAFLAALQLSIIIYAPMPFYLMYPLLFFTGISICTQILAFVSICEINSRSMSGVASGIHNMMCMISGVISQPLISFFLDLHWDGLLKVGAPYYSIANYTLALSILPLGLILAYILTFFMKETYFSIEKGKITIKEGEILLC